jgi:hypothetical protein
MKKDVKKIVSIFTILTIFLASFLQPVGNLASADELSALEAVNAAATEAEMRAAIEQPDLGLSYGPYGVWLDKDKNAVAMYMLANRGVGYPDITSIQRALYDSVYTHTLIDDVWNEAETRHALDLHSVAYGDGKFVAVGQGGTILISTANGWEPSHSGTTTDLYGIDYQDGQFTAVGDNGLVLISNDGVSWSQLPTNFTSNLNAVLYKNNQYMVAGEDGALHRSTDGHQWTTIQLQSSYDLQDIIYANHQYVVVGKDSEQLDGLLGIILTSVDGGVWEEYPQFEELDSIVYNEFSDLYNVAGYDPFSNLTSIINFKKDSLDFSYNAFDTNDRITSLAYGYGEFVGVGQNGFVYNYIDYEMGPHSWNQYYTNSSNDYTDVAYGDGRFVAVGKGGAITTQAAIPGSNNPVPSSNANLSHLELDQAGLSPAFSPDITAYTISISDVVTSMKVTPTTADSKATVTVNGNVTPNGSFAAISLHQQSTLITLVVTAEDGSTKTYTITVEKRATANAPVPSVTNATTAEDTQTSSGLVIQPRYEVESAVTNYYKISGITGGQLYQNDGVTPISEGQFITVTDGQSGLKFTPEYDQNGTVGFGFNVQAGPSLDGVKLSDPVEAVVTVTEVNDPPIAEGDVKETSKGTAFIDIPFAELTGNDSPGPGNESGQTLTITDVSEAVGGTVSIVDGHVRFDIDPGFIGTGSFTYQVTDNGTTSGVADFKSNSASVTIFVRDLTKPVITLSGDETVFLLQGQPYQELGYSAEDDVDGDLTSEVVVSGTVDSLVLGEYTLLYNVKDSSNNAANEQKRTIHVVSDLLSILTIGSHSIDVQPTRTQYTLDVANPTDQVTVTPTLVDGNSTLTLNGSVVGNGNSKEMTLNVGTNVITIVVTTLGGMTRTYTITVNRAPSSNADITNLVVSAGPLTPSFAAGTLDYTVGVANEVDGIEIKPVTTDSNATVKVNGVVVNGDEVNVPLVVGENEVTITVTAQDGATVKTYTITVTRDLFHPEAPAVTANDTTNLILGANETMEYSVNNGATWTNYNPQQAPIFAGNQTVLVRIKAVTGINIESPATTLVFTANPIFLPPTTNESVRVVQVVVVDAEGKSLPAVDVEIKRSTRDGQKVDTVALDEKNIQAAISKALDNKKNIIFVKLSDLENDKADRISLNIDKEVKSLLNQHAMNLVIQTEKGTISVPVSTWSQLGNEDLSITIANGQNQAQTNTIMEAMAKGAKVIGSSVKVDTNFKGRTEITVPIDKNLLPVNSKEWPAFIQSLAVLVEHSDGENKLYTGTIQYDVNGTPTGISIWVDKFSTFTVITKQKLPFTYVDDQTISEYARDSVYRLHDLGIMVGVKDQFNPKASLTRAEFTKVILNTLGITVEGTFKQGFKDVKNDHWAFAYMMKANELGFVKGVGGSKFNPNAPISRQQMALILGRALELKATSNNIEFLDQNQITREALPYVQALEELGIMKGTNNHFKPKDFVTREMMATIAVRVLDFQNRQ